MSKLRSRLPPSFSVTVGTYAIAARRIREYGDQGKCALPGGFLHRAAQEAQGVAAPSPSKLQQRPWARPADEGALRAKRVPLRGVAPHRRRSARGGPPLRGHDRAEPARIRV